METLIPSICAGCSQTQLQESPSWPTREQMQNSRKPFTWGNQPVVQKLSSMMVFLAPPTSSCNCHPCYGSFHAGVLYVCRAKTACPQTLSKKEPQNGPQTPPQTPPQIFGSARNTTHTHVSGLRECLRACLRAHLRTHLRTSAARTACGWCVCV